MTALTALPARAGENVPQATRDVPGSVAPGLRLPAARGPRSAGVVDFLTGKGATLLHATATPGDADDHDGDRQAALWLLNVLQVAEFEGVDPRRASSIDLRTLHWDLERWFEDRLRGWVPPARPQGLLAHLQRLIARAGVVGGPDGDASVERARLLAKAPYLGWEADPHTLALARVEAPLKPILVDIQSGEYGLGHADTHADIYRRCLDDLGTDLMTAVDTAPPCALAFANAAWLFGGDRRLRGAALGQLALLELDSVEPCVRAKQRWDRAGLPAEARRWYDVHALADVEHAAVVTEQLIPTLEQQTPWLVADAAWGAEVTWTLQERVARACVDSATD